MKRITERAVKTVKRTPTIVCANETTSRGKVAPSLQITSILVPTDLSSESKRALHYALSFAKEFGASVTLLHVVHAKCTALGRASDLALEDELRRGGASQLNALAHRFLGDEVPCDLLVRIGNPAAEIVSVARGLKSDLIVISTHGRTGLKHLLLGSVAETVLRHAPCPVLIVRSRQPEFHESQSHIAVKEWSAIPKPCVGTYANPSELGAETKN